MRTPTNNQLNTMEETTRPTTSEPTTDNGIVATVVPAKKNAKQCVKTNRTIRAGNRYSAFVGEIGHGAQQIIEFAPYFRILNAIVSAHQFQRFLSGHRVGLKDGLILVGKAR